MGRPLTPRRQAERAANLVRQGDANRRSAVAHWRLAEGEPLSGGTNFDFCIAFTGAKSSPLNHDRWWRCAEIISEVMSDCKIESLRVIGLQPTKP